MKRRISTWPLLACVASVGVTGAVLAQNGPQPPAPPGKAIKVGVVDIGVLFREYKRKDTLEAAVNQQREQIKGQIEKDAEEIQRLRRNLDKQFVPNSEPWLQLRDEIKLAEGALQLKQERLQTLLKKRVEELTLQILNELETTIREYGQRHGFDLILKSDKQEEPADQGGEPGLTQHFQERIFRAQISDVLFFTGQLEITENVKALLNSPQNMAKMEQLMKEKEQRRQAAPGQQPAAPLPAGQQQPPPSAPPGANRGG